MAEWLKAAVLKTVSGVTRSGVRIPLPPPYIRFRTASAYDRASSHGAKVLQVLFRIFPAPQECDIFLAKTDSDIVLFVDNVFCATGIIRQIVKLRDDCALHVFNLADFGINRSGARWPGTRVDLCTVN